MVRKTHNKKTLWLACPAFLFCVAVMSFFSCGKKVDLEGAHLTGVYRGQECGNTPLNVTVRENEDKKSFKMEITPTGFSNCLTTFDVTGVLKSADSVMFDKQFFTDKCKNEVSAFGSGHISGHAYQYFIKFIRTSPAGKMDSIVKCFSGSK